MGARGWALVALFYAAIVFVDVAYLGLLHALLDAAIRADPKGH